MVGSHTALVQAGIPSDLYIFPDEDHIKWQPAHRLAVYERNLAWFNFWLKNEMPPDPAQLDEAGRWKAMKDSRSEERRVGNEGVRTCRSRGSPHHKKKNTAYTMK